MGVEVGTSRVWKRAEAGNLARVVFVNMLDRERADFYRALGQLTEQLSPKCVAIALPIGAEHELTGVVDLLHMVAYTSPEGDHEAAPGPNPAELEAEVAEYREKLLDAVVETDEGLMERYLEGEELAVDEVAHALKDAVTRGEIFPVAAGVATKNLGTTGAPRPARRGRAVAGEAGRPGAGRRAPARRRSCSRRSPTRSPAASRCSASSRGRSRPTRRSRTSRAHSKERLGQLLLLQGKEHTAIPEFGEGDIGAVAKLKETQPAISCSTPSARSTCRRSTSPSP